MIIAALAALLALAVGVSIEKRVLDHRLPGLWFDAVLDMKSRQARKLRRRFYRPEVLVVGHSMVFDWFDPTTFAEVDPRHRKGYNAGANFTIWDVAEDWLTYLLSVWNPAVVVLGLSAVDLNANGTDQVVCVDRHRAAPAGLHGGRIPARVLLRHTLPLLIPRRGGFRRALREGAAALPDAARLIGPLGTDLHKVGRGYGMNDGFAKAFSERWLYDFCIAEPAIEHVRRLVRLAGSRGARVAVVHAPCTDDFVGLLAGGAESRGQAGRMLERICADEGARYLEPPSDMLPADLFADPIHLNDRGTQVMTRWIAEQQL